MLGFEDDEISNHFSEWDKRLHPHDRDRVYADLNDHLIGKVPFYENEHRLQCKDGNYKWVLDRGKIISWTDDGKPLRVAGTHTDIHERKETEIENIRLVQELKDALANIKLLRGLVPICAWCKNIRDDNGFWNQLEDYISKHTEAEFSHGICPSCMEKAEAEDGLIGK